MRILIIRVSAIGDVVHTLPALFLLKHLLPDCSVSWVVQKKAADLLHGQPLLDHVWVLPDHYLSPLHCITTMKILNEIRQHHWDAIIDFQGLFKTSFIMMFLRGKKFGFSQDHVRSRLTTLWTHVHHAPEYTNIVQKNISLASHVAFLLRPYRSCPAPYTLAEEFVFRVSYDKQRVVDQWCQVRGMRDRHIVLLTPNTTWDEKHWPIERWIELVLLWAGNEEVRRQTIFVLVGKDHGAAARAVYEGCLAQGVKLESVPCWDLATLACLVKRAALVIAPDTGILHLADFLGTQTIALFGPTRKEVHGPFWQLRNKENAYQMNVPQVGIDDEKKQKAVFYPGGMYTLKSKDLFERMCKCLGIPGGTFI